MIKQIILFFCVLCASTVSAQNGKLVNKVFPENTDTSKVINFMDKVCEQDLQKVIDNAYNELKDYLNALKEKSNYEEVLRWTTGLDANLSELKNLSGLAPAKTISKPAFNHDSKIETCSIVLDNPISNTTFDNWLDTLVGIKGSDILRIKGLVFLEGIEAPFVFHGVQQIFDPPVQLKTWSNEDRKSRIVVIARNISQLQLQKSLEMLRIQNHD